jgi:hypothetical protein
MNLHPDVLTDLVILYHAGEASEASRALLEDEAKRNPRVAAALGMPPRPMAPLPVTPPDVHRRALHDINSALIVRLVFSVVAVATALILLALFLPPTRLGHPWLPVAMLVLVFGAVAIALRAHRRL